MITTLDLLRGLSPQPGAFTPLAAAARELGVSAGALRPALRSLEAQKLVVGARSEDPRAPEGWASSKLGLAILGREGPRAWSPAGDAAREAREA